jgi:hypothetical protein
MVPLLFFLCLSAYQIEFAAVIFFQFAYLLLVIGVYLAYPAVVILFDARQFLCMVDLFLFPSVYQFGYFVIRSCFQFIELSIMLIGQGINFIIIFSF